MNKTLALVALLGLVAAPAFANEAAKAPVAAPAVKAEKVVAKEDAAKEGEMKTEETAKDAKAPVAAEVKKDEKK